MSNVEAILKAGKRKSYLYHLGDCELHLYEMSWSQQKEWTEKFNGDDNEVSLQYATLVCMCCDELKDCDPSALVETWSRSVLLDVGNKVLELSQATDTEKK